MDMGATAHLREHRAHLSKDGYGCHFPPQREHREPTSQKIRWIWLQCHFSQPTSQKMGCKKTKAATPHLSEDGHGCHTPPLRRWTWLPHPTSQKMDMAASAHFSKERWLPHPTSQKMYMAATAHFSQHGLRIHRLKNTFCNCRNTMTSMPGEAKRHSVGEVHVDIAIFHSHCCCKSMPGSFVAMGDTGCLPVVSALQEKDFSEGCNG
eukprot:c27982_g4_i1 orf=104-724(+)